MHAPFFITGTGVENLMLRFRDVEHSGADADLELLGVGDLDSRLRINTLLDTNPDGETHTKVLYAL